MATRLTVVVSQSAQRDDHSADLEESLAAELMMSPGLDTTVVGPLERVQTDDTDFLCISSFNHSIALASWLSASDVQQHWSRLGLVGQIVSLDTLQNLEPSTAPKVYHLQLHAGSNIAASLTVIRKILADRSVKTVGLALPGSKTPSAAIRAQPAEPTFTAKPKASPPATSAAKPLTNSRPHTDADDEDYDHLDRLVDDFESLDL